MEAFAIKDSTGRIIDIGLDEADLKRQWHPSYRCVPVQVTEIEPKPPIEVNSKSQLARITAQGGNAVPKAPK